MDYYDLQNHDYVLRLIETIESDFGKDLSKITERIEKESFEPKPIKINNVGFHY